MSLKQTIAVFELLNNPNVSGNDIKQLFSNYANVEITINQTCNDDIITDFIHILIPGSGGKNNHGDAPTMGIIGQLAGIGVRPKCIGLVSDADGAIAAIACALKLAEMNLQGDILPGDVVITTHLCTNALTIAHAPVDFVLSPVDMKTMLDYLVDHKVDAVLSIDTTKGNNILNHKGYAITPTVKEGCILKVSEDLLSIMASTSGMLPITCPLSIQDITPYGNGLYHLNSMMQPATITTAPVVGVAICTQTPVAGYATCASHEVDITNIVKFAIATSIAFCNNECQFYDPIEFNILLESYGSFKHIQTMGIKGK